MNNNRKSSILKTTPDFDSVIRIVFWNGLGFIFFSFLKSFAVIYYFEGSGFDLGLIFSIQPLARLFVTPLIGYLTDKIPKKNLIFVGSIGRSFSYIIYYISFCIKSLELFGTGIMIQGVIVGFYWNAYSALIAEKSCKTNRTEAYGKGRGKQVGKGNILGAAISFPIFAIASFTGAVPAIIYCPLIIFSVSNLISGTIFFKNVDESLTYDRYVASLNQQVTVEEICEEENRIESLRIKNGEVQNQTFKQKAPIGLIIGFVLFLIAVLIYFTNGTISIPFIRTYLTDEILINFFPPDDKIIPILILILYFPAQVISQMISQKIGEISDRHNNLISLILIYLFRALFTWLLIVMVSPWTFALILIFYHTTVIANTYLMHSIVSRVSTTHRGKIFGAYEVMRLLGSVIGPMIGGIIWDNPSLSRQTPFIISAIVLILMIPYILFAIWKLKPYMAEKIDL